MITLKKIVKTYYNKSVGTEVLKGVDLSVSQGEFICIYGTSGSGKSTLLNIMGLLDSATSGIYELDGVNVQNLKKEEIAKIRNKKLGFVFQAYHLIPELNVLENIVVPLGYSGISKKERERMGRNVMEEFQMLQLEKKYMSQMSGGEQQRIAIMRAIINQPRVLLADEPTGNLDHDNSRMVMEIFKRLNEKGMTIVMVTHDKSLAAYATRSIHLEDGYIVL